MLDTLELSHLVEPGRVNRRVYTDPQIFELEMERIFSRVWIYLGHESQVKAPGDFFTTRIGRKSVIVSRHNDGSLKAFHNRCTHRGALICAESQGNTKRFVCPYHAWSFNTAGQLVGVPHSSGYGQDYDQLKKNLHLEQVARLESYRGFIFGSLANMGPDLKEYLGSVVCEAFDNFVERSPEGELELSEGSLIQTFRANWKLQIENSIDMVHPPILHHNVINVSEKFLTDTLDSNDIPPAIDVFRNNGLAFKEWDEIGIYAMDHGHCYMEGFFRKMDDLYGVDDARFGSDDQLRFNSQDQYVKQLVEKYGKEKAEKILGFHRHNTIIYPNLFINPRIQQLRILQPVSVNLTEQHCYVFRLKGAPEEALHTAVAFLTASNSPSSIATTDDHEIFERIQDGLVAGDSEWLNLSRGLGREVPFAHGMSAEGTNELAMRNQHKAWVNLMTETL